MDFQLDEETGHTKVREGERAIIGGMIAAKTIKYTKTNKTMAFLNIEDLMGTVEVMVFPKDYEKSKQYLNEDAKVFVKGRVSEEDGGASKLICETVIPFEDVPCELWIQFADIPSYQSEESNLFEMLKHSEGTDRVVIYCAKEKAVKRLSANRNIHLDADLLMAVEKYFGKDRVKVVEKQLEKV
jgi:DNA polymerase-3 subunit alpha